MRKLIRFVLWVLYRLQYRDGKNSPAFAYFFAVQYFLLPVFFDLLILLRILNIGARYAWPWWRESDPKVIQYLEVGAFYFLPGYLVVSSLFKREEIMNLKHSDDALQRGRKGVLIWLFVSFIGAAFFARW